MSDESLESKITNTRKAIFKGTMELAWLRIKPNIELSEKQQERYNSWNDMANTDSKLYKLFKPYENERDYLIHQKRKEVRLKKGILAQYTCEKKGHVEGKIANCNGIVYVNCKRCRTSYHRNMNSKEQKSWDDLMNTPFNI